MAFDRSRIMKTAHREWRAVKHRPGMTFGRCLKLAWAVERKRLAGREYYNPEHPDKLSLTACPRVVYSYQREPTDQRLA